ncbi:hypothetical protein C8J56DRAFT_1159029 [Mycena floridula]|nr:hypothetical protein C8J56DRAFT_1159029 [Mycena floridula]
MDFIQNLDPSKLVLVQTILSFLLAPFAAPPYNFPLFLFGTYSQDNADSESSLQTFTGLLGGSMIFDVVWMIQNEQGGLTKFLTVVLLLLKIPTFLTFAVKQRGGGQLAGLGGIRGGDLSGATVWSMPGGFTSTGREGYQSLDEPASERPVPAGVPVTKPTVPASQPLAQAPGGYQDV